MLPAPAHQLQGELAISVPRHRHPRATITAGKGWGICRFTHTSQARGDQPPPQTASCSKVPSLARPIYNQQPFCFFEYFVLPKALKPSVLAVLVLKKLIKVIRRSPPHSW